VNTITLWNTVLFEKLVIQLVKFPTFNGTQRFITVDCGILGYEDVYTVASRRLYYFMILYHLLK
jgi:hypothetical protein